MGLHEVAVAVANAPPTAAFYASQQRARVGAGDEPQTKKKKNEERMIDCSTHHSRSAEASGGRMNE
jgi:ribosomal protein L12E/L44/L45/RPP1/RPP2